MRIENKVYLNYLSQFVVPITAPIAAVVPNTYSCPAWVKLIFLGGKGGYRWGLARH